MTKKDIVKDTIIENLNNQVKNYKLMDEKHQENNIIKDNINKQLTSDNKKLNRNNKVLKVLFALVTAGLIIK